MSKKNKSWVLPYNTEEERMVIPEYGRNVHNLIAEAEKVEDLHERTAYIERIVDLMAQMSPSNKSLEEYREKLWNHVFKIADDGLNVIVPEGIEIKPKEKKPTPEPVSYPHFNIKRRHYGYNVQQMIENARAMEDEEMQEDYAEVIGSYMKLAYRTWARDHYVSDEVILDDLEVLSEGELSLGDEGSLDNLANPKNRSRNNNNNDRRQNNSGGRRGRGRNRSNNNNNRGRNNRNRRRK